MAEDESELSPSADKAVFLLTIPPKSLFHDQHRCVQLQRVIHRSDATGARIRPIFNLEYHKMFATRVIELEDDDAKVAEFHPIKGHHEESSESSKPHMGSVRRRKRTFSIDGKNGALGGNISSQARKLGLCDMTVAGSERLGHLTFAGINGVEYTWRKALIDDSPSWILEDSVQETMIGDADDTGTLPLPKASGNDKIRTSYEFLRSPEQPRPLHRVGTSLTLASQYTTHFENESQLSGLTSTPQVDPRDVVTSKTSHPSALQKQPRAILAVSPLPHVRIALDQGGFKRHSMHEITNQNEEIYRILLCALWIIWSSPDFSFEPETQQKTATESSQSEGVTLIDRHSKIGLSKNTSEHSIERRRKSSANSSMPIASPSPHKKKGSVFSVIAKICGG